MITKEHVLEALMSFNIYGTVDGKPVIDLANHLVKELNRKNKEIDETISLQDFIAKLSEVPQFKNVVYAGGSKPGDFGSSRGYYEQLALGIAPNSAKNTSVRFLLSKAKKCIGKNYRGYKSGIYKMHHNSPVWCDNYGHWSNTAIIDVVEEDDKVVLITRKIED
jgi:hypothetical protein